VAVLTQPGKWTFALLFNQLWSTSGAKDRKDVDVTYLQPTVSYNLGNGPRSGRQHGGLGQLGSR
jgi:hypothetical protein